MKDESLVKEVPNSQTGDGFLATSRRGSQVYFPEPEPKENAPIEDSAIDPSPALDPRPRER